MAARVLAVGQEEEDASVEIEGSHTLTPYSVLGGEFISHICICASEYKSFLQIYRGNCCNNCETACKVSFP